MNKRTFLQCSGGTLLFPWMLCRAADANGEQSYKESISSVLISGDEKTLVVMNDQYHYIFDVNPVLVRVIKADFHKYAQAQFSTFKVDRFGITRGDITLTLVDAPEGARKEALAMGLKPDENGGGMRVLFTGRRYKAGRVQPQPKYLLNEVYEVNVDAEPQYTEPRMTPIQVVGFGLAIVGVALFALALFGACAVEGTSPGNCHE